MTYFLVLSFLLCGYFKYLLIIVLILFVHDIGHVIFIKFLGYKIDCIEILPFGANIITNIGFNSNSEKVFLISVAGILMQLILYVICYILFSFDVISIIDYEIFYKYNTFLILFNMLPIYPLDGHKALISLLELIVSFKLSLILGYILSFLFILLFLSFNYWYDLDNYFIIFFLVFKLIEYIKEHRFIMNKFFMERYLSKKTYKKISYTNSLNKIRKNYLNFINNQNEKKVLENKLFKY